MMSSPSFDSTVSSLSESVTQAWFSPLLLLLETGSRVGGPGVCWSSGVGGGTKAHGVGDMRGDRIMARRGREGREGHRSWSWSRTRGKGGSKQGGTRISGGVDQSLNCLQCCTRSSME